MLHLEKGLKTLTLKKGFSKRHPQAPLAAMSSCAFESQFALLKLSSSPVRGSGCGSTVTLEHTSDNKDDVMSRTSL